MTIDSNVLNSKPIALLCEMYAAEYTSQVSRSTSAPVPSMLNAVGACAGFAAQVAVWRELVLPAKRNPGDFFAYLGRREDGLLFFGEAINQFLFATVADRVSFLSLAGIPLSDPSELPDIMELTAHVARSVGSDAFGRPRVPPPVELAELPRLALSKTWSKASRIMAEHQCAEWPALLGAAACKIIDANQRSLAPTIAVRIVLEAAVPMSKLNPETVEDSGIPAPSFANWSWRAVRPQDNDTIVAEVRRVMPAMPPKISAIPAVIDQPKVVFLNLSGSACEAIVTKDQIEIGAAFHGNVEVAAAPGPVCDVLFLYCDLAPSGEITGQTMSIRDVIRESRASIAVIASQVPYDFFSNRTFQKAVDRSGNPPVNLVITNNRNGDAFGRFFKSLFELMWTGLSMSMAWVTLAPQGPVSAPNPKDAPGTLYLMEAPQVSFAKRP
jgi:hypothetical protein